MIERNQYRACLKSGIEVHDWSRALSRTCETLKEQKEDGCILTACMYRYENMLFLYVEALRENCDVEAMFSELTSYLEMWPEQKGLTPWAKMYHIYHHSMPDKKDEWIKERAVCDKRIGRIAFLKPEKLFSYTYWHYAIVEEGLLKGDKYQYISLHENILFSYFEEPRTNVNIKGIDEESKVIDGWLAVDPESHFDREKAHGNNFLIIDPVFII